jgi:D-alanyl-D-alanine carboxypeptidase/D-alanyl-D-alanine-endopeptidase (penicillin-binding protein 4)
MKTLNSKLVSSIICSLLYIFLLSSCAPNRSIFKTDSALPFKKIENILQDSIIQKGQIGIRFVDAKTGDILYEKNSKKFFQPASNIKLITTAGALLILKPEYRYKTSILTDGKLSGDTLKGNLYIKGSGDPTLNSEILSLIAKQLRIKGISHIQGDILYDDSYFDTIPYGKGWMWDDLQYNFGTPISALSVNGNMCKVYVKPNKNEGDTLMVNIEPSLPFIKIRNKATTGKDKKLIVNTILEKERTTITIEGKLPPDKGIKTFIRPITKPAFYAASLLADRMKENNIEITGKIDRKSLNQVQDILFIHESEPLIKILYDMDKSSSNFIAEHILKTIGAEAISIPGTAENGIKAIKNILKEKEIIKEDFKLSDGSGLSRYNLISPQQVTSLLFYLYHRFEYAPEFLTLLPTSGVDGTLKSRMVGTGVKRKIRAKTGTMSGISSLSGYCITNSGKILIFSIMMENYVANPSYVRNLQDKILKAAMEF